MNSRRWDQLEAGEITAMRKERGLTQADLAKVLVVRQATISDWENGIRKPSRLAVMAMRYWWENSKRIVSNLPPQI